MHLAADAGRADVMDWLQSHADGELDTPLPATDSNYPNCTATEIYSRQHGTINAAATEHDEASPSARLALLHDGAMHLAIDSEEVSIRLGKTAAL